MVGFNSFCCLDNYWIVNMKVFLVLFIWFSSGDSLDIEVKNLGYFDTVDRCQQVANRLMKIHSKEVDKRLLPSDRTITHAVCIPDLKINKL